MSSLRTVFSPKDDRYHQYSSHCVHDRNSSQQNQTPRTRWRGVLGRMPEGLASFSFSTATKDIIQKKKGKSEYYFIQFDAMEGFQRRY